MRIAKFLICILVVLPIFAQSRSLRGLDDTCQGFVKALEDANETMDQSRPQEYSDTAEKIYDALNKVVIQVGLLPLPLPDDLRSKADRSLRVVDQCQKNMTAMYHDAVADSYVTLRGTAGLPTDVPTR